MKIVCEKNDLLAALTTVGKALSPRTTFPALEGVILDAQGGKVTLTAFDMLLAIESVIYAEVQDEGKCLLPGRLTTEVIRKMPDGPVQIELKGNQAVISAEKTQTTVSVMNLDEFPMLPMMGEGTRLTLPQKVFRDLVFKTFFAVAVDESRPILNGILLEITPDKIKAVALDGYRLAVAETEFKTNLTMNVVIPGRSLMETARILTEENEQIDLLIEQKYVLFDLGHTKIISRLMEGDYIKYESIIPKEFLTEVVLNRTMLEDSVERAALIARENRTNVVVMNIRPQQVIITAKAENGDAYEELPASVYGKELEIAFNSKYILDCLKAVEDEYVKFYFKTGLSPSILRAAEEKGPDKYLYLILPVRM